jgi:hypothetical protein
MQSFKHQGQEGARRNKRGIPSGALVSFVIDIVSRASSEIAAGCDPL